MPKVRCPAVIFIQHNRFAAIWEDATRRVADWHTNCLEKARKEKANEDQDECEGGFWRGQADREHQLFVRESGLLNVVSRRGFRKEETMKSKTNVKAGCRKAGGDPSTAGK